VIDLDVACSSERLRRDLAGSLAGCSERISIEVKIVELGFNFHQGQAVS